MEIAVKLRSLSLTAGIIPTKGVDLHSKAQSNWDFNVVAYTSMGAQRPGAECGYYN
jgi:hypothetical protein